MHSENLVENGNQPIDERSFFEAGDAVQAHRHPIAGSEHGPADLPMHSVYIIHERRRRNDAAQVDRSRNEQDDQVQVPVFFGMHVARFPGYQGLPDATRTVFSNAERGARLFLRLIPSPFSNGGMDATALTGGGSLCRSSLRVRRQFTLG